LQNRGKTANKQKDENDKSAQRMEKGKTDCLQRTSIENFQNTERQRHALNGLRSDGS